MLSQNQTAKNQRNQKVCNNQKLSQNQNYLIKKRLFVVHTQIQSFDKGCNGKEKVQSWHH